MSASGIPTDYKGVRFRSRAEARWAAVFEQYGWRWEYEPIDLFGYIPDFVLYLDKPVLVEVKGGALTKADLLPFRWKIQKSGWKGEALLLAASHLGPSASWSDATILGLIAERWDEEWVWGEAMAFVCGFCQRLSFCHDYGSWRCRVSGCYDGDGYVQSCARAGHDPDDALRCAGRLTMWERIMDSELGPRRPGPLRSIK